MVTDLLISSYSLSLTIPNSKPRRKAVFAFLLYKVFYGFRSL